MLTGLFLQELPFLCKTWKCPCDESSGKCFFNVAHGVANAVLLPVIAEYNALADHGGYLTDL